MVNSPYAFGNNIIGGNGNGAVCDFLDIYCTFWGLESILICSVGNLIGRHFKSDYRLVFAL